MLNTIARDLLVMMTLMTLLVAARVIAVILRDELKKHAAFRHLAYTQRPQLQCQADILGRPNLLFFPPTHLN